MSYHLRARQRVQILAIVHVTLHDEVVVPNKGLQTWRWMSWYGTNGIGNVDLFISWSSRKQTNVFRMLLFGCVALMDPHTDVSACVRPFDIHQFYRWAKRVHDAFCVWPHSVHVSTHLPKQPCSLSCSLTDGTTRSGQQFKISSTWHCVGTSAKGGLASA